MRRHGDWFTIVATDLFASAFASILLIDAATPKEPLTLGQPSLFTMRYSAPNTMAGLNCSDPYNVAFVFTDELGDTYNTLEADLSGERAGEFCQVIGILDDVSLSNPPTDGRILVVRRPAGPPIGDVAITVGGHKISCEESTLCTSSF